ncbi:MAG: hypothetical protein JNL83_05720 [Myxococcales bacterium]|nr:hypothetical protein [Myxococcales bacterium]
MKRRSPLGISGVLLFMCLFLPTLRVCGDPTAPIQFPPTYGIYIGGLLVGFLGFSVVRQVRRNLMIGLAGIYIASVGAFVSIWVGAVSAEIAGFLLGALMIGVLIVALRLMVRTTWTERAPAVMCVVHALVALGWSSLLAFDDDGMWGAMVSLGAASLMLFASIGYAMGAFAEERAAEEPALPSARVIG